MGKPFTIGTFCKYSKSRLEPFPDRELGNHSSRLKSSLFFIMSGSGAPKSIDLQTHQHILKKIDDLSDGNTAQVIEMINTWLLKSNHQIGSDKTDQCLALIN